LWDNGGAAEQHADNSSTLGDKHRIVCDDEQHAGHDVFEANSGIDQVEGGISNGP
jgi:hypothetical protein